MAGAIRPVCRCVRSEVWFDADPIVDGVPKTLFAAEIPFGRLDRNVAEQELDLVQFPLRHRGTGERMSDEGRAAPDSQWLLFWRSPSRHAFLPLKVGKIQFRRLSPAQPPA